MANPIKFGTDGWRAVIAEDFTFTNVRICTQGMAGYLKEAGLTAKGIIIGYDTRFASENFAAASAEVLAANGIRSYVCSSPTPTPVVSYGVLAQKVDGAIIITASHNPGTYNGFKVKTGDGASAPTEVIARLEDNIKATLAAGKVNAMPLAQARAQNLVKDLDLAPVYFEQVKRLVNLDKLKQSKLKVIIDPMYGAGSGYLKTLLAGGKIEAIEINGERNPAFPGMERPEPIAPNLTRLAALVKEQGAAVGLATDGDADRIGIITEKGEFLNQLQVFALLALYLLEVRGQRGPIVKTVTATNMLYRLGKVYEVPVYETPVGFKYVAPLMLEKGAIIGGEESGGYGFKNHAPERDGILAGLFFLDFMVSTGKTPSELLDYLYNKVGPHYYDRVDVEAALEQHHKIIMHIRGNLPDTIDGVKVAKIDTSDGFRFILADDSWLLIRFSGTEPLLRIYGESTSQARLDRLLEAGRKLVGV